MVYIVGFLLFVLPLIVFPFLTLAFEPPKVLIAQIGIEVLFIISLFSTKFDFKKINPLLILLCSVLVLLSLFHLAFYPKQVNLFGNIFRLQGVLLLWHLLLFALASSQFKLPGNFRNLYLVSFLGIVTSAFLLGENRAGRAVGTLGEPNALASTAVILFPFIFFQFKNKWVRWGSLVMTLVVVLLARSASGLLAFSLQTIFIQLIMFSKLPLAKTYLVFLAIIGASLILPFTNLTKQLTNNPAVSPFKFESRGEIWQTAFVSGFKNPLLGSGFGSVQKSLNETSIAINNTVQYQVVDSSHNFILDYWLQGGVVGLLVILSLIGLAMHRLLVASKRLELTIFLGVLIAMLFNPVSVVTLLFFFFLIGQGLGSIISES